MIPAFPPQAGQRRIVPDPGHVAEPGVEVLVQPVRRQPDLARGGIAGGVVIGHRAARGLIAQQFRQRRVGPPRRARRDPGMLWLVRRAGLARAFHSRADDPFAAMAEAEAAWRRRADQRPLRPQVRAIVRDLRWLRRRMWVCRADACRSPLCDEGVDAFLRSLGLGRFDCFPGWLIAWLFAFDRQVGFVLCEADQRVRAALSLPGDPGAAGAGTRGRAAPH